MVFCHTTVDRGVDTDAPESEHYLPGAAKVGSPPQTANWDGTTTKRTYFTLYNAAFCAAFGVVAYGIWEKL